MFMAVRFCVNAGFPELVGIAAGGLALIAVGGVAAGIYLLQRRFALFQDDSPKYLAVELILAVLLFMAGVYLRSHNIAQAGQDTYSYFNAAYVTEDQEIPITPDGKRTLYVYLLHVIFFLFGNKLTAGVWLQIVLQISALGCVFGAVHKLSGAITAFSVLLFGALSPMLIMDSVRLSPKAMVFLAYGVAFLMLANAVEEDKSYGYWFLAGAIVGFAGWLDIACFSLLGLLVLLWQKPTGMQRTEKYLLQCGCALLGGAVSFLLLLAVTGSLIDKSPLRIVRAWWNLQNEIKFSIPLAFYEGQPGWEIMLLVVILSFGIFGFWMNHEEFISPWILVSICIGLLTVAGVTAQESSWMTFLYMNLAAIAGGGIRSMFGKSKKQTRQTEFVSKEVLFSDDVASGKQEETSAEENGNTDHAQNAAQTSNSAAAGAGMIENPLPVPKRHKKPMLDFDIDSMAGKDFYDVRVSDDDDYDIK